jgi:hypothetical protein
MLPAKDNAQADSATASHLPWATNWEVQMQNVLGSPMQGFNYHGKQIDFFRITGEVIDSEKRSETHVHGGGGGGEISGWGGSVTGKINPVSISSSTTLHHNVWIKTEDGSEKNISLPGNRDVPLRIGHKITIVLALFKGKQISPILINHTANLHHILINGAALNHLFNIKQVSVLIYFMAFWLAILLIPLLGNLFNAIIEGWGGGIGFIAGPAVTIVLMQKTFIKKQKEVDSRLQSHLEQLVRAAYQS